MPHLNYLTAHRKRWALSQNDLGALLGLSGSSVSRYETGNRKPHLLLALHYEIIFGVPARALFPDQYAEIEHLVVERAAKFSIPLELNRKAPAEVKRELLAMINARACGNDGAA